MTTLAEVQELFDYNRWANARLLAVAASLPPEALERDLGSSFPSIRATLAHMLGADWIWLRRWKGTSPTGLPEDWDLSTLDTIRARWREVEEELSELLTGLTEEQLSSPVHYRNTKGTPYTNPLGDLMRHVVNHGSYHRGQIVTLLRQLGAEPVSTDLVLYYRERDGAA